MRRKARLRIKHLRRPRPAWRHSTRLVTSVDPRYVTAMGGFPYCAFPESLMVQTTSRCNASCIFCPYPAVRGSMTHGEMSQTLFLKLMRESSRYQVKSINLFLMNEPLMDRCIVDRIDLAKEHNPEAAVCLWSNGVNLDQQLSTDLLESGLDAIGISIHAMWPETYEQLTGRKDFDKVLKRVTRFVELRNEQRPGLRVEIRLVGVRQFLSPEEVDEAVAYWQGYGIADVESLLGHVNRAGNLPGTYQIIHRETRGCADRMPYHMAAVTWRGDVVLCCMDWRQEQVLGNIRRQGLASIWRGERRREVLAQLAGEMPSPDDFLCKRCEESIAGERSHRDEY